MPALTGVPLPNSSAGEPLDISNCDREPIHIPGHIQAHGAMLVLDPARRLILQASENCAAYFGVAAERLLGQDLGALLAPEARAELERGLRSERIEANPLHLFTGALGTGAVFDVIAHQHQGLLFLEAEPTIAAPPPNFHRLLKHSVSRFQGAGSVREFCHMATEEVRRVSGYDRVMIYQFQEDWSGQVIAEDMAPASGLAPFLDLRYPASDIPAQARALFLMNTLRLLPDARYRPSPLVPLLNPVTGRPPDLSYAFLRGASQMYTEYLTNMGVRASLTVAITHEERLWGLIACHHYAPRRVSGEVRVACEFLGRIVSMQVVDKQRHEEASYRRQIHAVHEHVVLALASHGDARAALTDAPPTIADFLSCGGAAMIEGDVCRRLGRTPSEAQVLALVAWLSASQEGEVFTTSALPRLYPAAAAFQEVASGLLAIRVSQPDNHYLLWFRPEVTQDVKWAGDPHKPVEIGPMGDRLTPRRSFALWQETVHGTALPFRPFEVDAARRLRMALGEVVFRKAEALARLNTELARSNLELDSFAYVASHDLKEPLRGIYNYCMFFLEDYEHQLDPAGKHKLETVVRLTKRMQSLIDSLLHFSRLGRSPMNLALIDLGVAVADARELLTALLSQGDVSVVIPRPLPVVRADRLGLLEVYSNLISNAVKYNDAAAKRVEVGYLCAGEAGFPAAAQGSERCFYVRDNGIGIPAQHRKDVFRIFKRLHAQTEYGGGTGAGLTIVHRVVERHGGVVWVEPAEPAGSTFFFTLASAH